MMQEEETTPLLAPRNNLQAALESIRYITQHVVKENEVREVRTKVNRKPVSYSCSFIFNTKSSLSL